MMETMIPPKVGMRLRTKKRGHKKEKAPKKEKRKKREKGHKKEKAQKIMREKERRDNVTILFHTCASK